MNKGIVLLPILMIAIVATGCNMEEKIGEKIAEELIEKSAGDEVEVNIDGEDVTYTTEDGEVTFSSEDEDTFEIESEDGSVMQGGEDMKWPTDQAAAYLPSCSAGKVSYLMNSEESCIIIMDEVSQDDYDDYVQTIKDAGFTNNAVESTAEDMDLYSGSSADNIIVTVYISPSESVMQVTVDTSQKQ